MRPKILFILSFLLRQRFSWVNIRTYKPFFCQTQGFHTKSIANSTFNNCIQSSITVYDKLIEKHYNDQQHFFLLFKYLNPLTSFEILNNKYNYDENFHKVPKVGSLVEVRSTDDNQVDLGIIIREPHGIFRSSQTSFQMLSMSGEIIDFKTKNITFHLFQLFDKRKVLEAKNLNVLQNLILYLAKSSIKFSTILKSQKLLDDAAFLKISRSNSIGWTNVSNYLMRIPLFNNFDFYANRSSLVEQSDLNKLCRYLAVHLIFTNDCSRYILIPNKGNFIKASYRQQFSQLIPDVSIFTNSTYNSILINHFLNFDRSQLEKFNLEIREIIQTDMISTGNKFYKWLNNSIFITKEEIQLYKILVNALKYYIIYPHEMLHLKLKVIFKDLYNDSLPSELKFLKEDINPRMINNFLVHVNIYKSDTDIFLSNNTLSTKSWKKSSENSISLVSQLVNSPDVINTDLKFLTDFSFLDNPALQQDNFAHLRYIRDTPVFILDDQLAVSMETKSERNITINIHIPDIGLFIYPKSSITGNLILNGKDLDLFNGKLSYLPKSIKENFKFQQRERKGINCFTISFNYDPWKSGDQFDYEKLDIDCKLEFLTNLKEINLNRLSDVLNNKLEFLGIFENVEDPDRLRKSDKEEIRQIYNICKRRNYFRNADGSLECEDMNEKQIPVLRVEENESREGVNYEYSVPCRESNDRRLFFVKELRLMTDELFANYSIRHQIPIFHHSQKLLNVENKSNEYVEVIPDNYLLPSFKAYNYDHFVFGKVSGNVVPTAYICGLNFMDLPQVGFDTSKELSENWADTRLGLRVGTVKMSNPFESIENLFNQWQLLANLHKNGRESISKQRRFNTNKIDTVLKIKGYKLLSSDALSHSYRNFIEPRNKVLDYLTVRINSFWMLKYTEEQLQFRDRNLLMLKCVVVESATYPELATAYCLDLCIYATIELDPPSGGNPDELVIGDQIICSKIKYVSPVEGRLILSI